MAAEAEAGFPDFVQIRARARVVEGVLGVVVGVVFGPEEMVVTNAFRSRVVRYDDVTSITYNGWTWVHNRSLVVVSRTDGWVSVDAVRRRMLQALIGLDDQSRLMQREIERRVQLARSGS